MPSRNEAVAAAGAERSTLYVAIEISAKSWVVGIKGPTSERIGLHSLGAADVDGLKDLVERQRAKAERDLGREVRVLCLFSDIALEGSATSEMTGWAERRPGVARL